MKRKQGISLVVLVITIIIIMILAAAVILSISNNNPIENAKQGKVAYNEALLKEAANLAYMAYYTENNLLNDTTEVSDYVYEKLEEQGFSTEEIAKVAISDSEGIKYGVNLITIPNGFEYVSIKNSEGKETSTASTGYVIKNSSDGNEFVWVPVENISEFKRESFQDTPLSGNYTEPYTASATEVAEYNAMIASVEKYGGFYIARYEASKKTVDGVEIAQSIPKQTTWTNISWGTSMMNPGENGAVGKSRAIYPVSKATKEKDAVSTLVYGVQWDQTIRFLEKNYPGISKNSTEKGNYQNSSFSYSDLEGNIIEKKSWTSGIIPTGSTEHTNTNNIYDMAGNFNEWTMEVNSEYNLARATRGGSCYLIGENCPIPNRFYVGTTYINSDVGFRFALYIK